MIWGSFAFSKGEYQNQLLGPCSAEKFRGIIAEIKSGRLKVCCGRLVYRREAARGPNVLGISLAAHPAMER